MIRSCDPARVFHERSAWMRGDDPKHDQMFSYVTPEQRVRRDHPLRPIRQMTDAALARLSPRFDRLYSTTGRPSVPPEQLLRALLLQILYSIRSERLLMEELDYSVLYRWFVGLSLDDPIWDATTFTKNQDRLLDATWRPRSLQKSWPRSNRTGCSPTSTSPWMARCSKRGPATRVSNRRRRPERRPTTAARSRILSWAPAQVPRRPTISRRAQGYKRSRTDPRALETATSLGPPTRAP